MAYREIERRPSKDALLEAYNTPGASTRSLAAHYGVSMTTVARWVLAAGGTLKSVGDTERQARLRATNTRF